MTTDSAAADAAAGETPARELKPSATGRNVFPHVPFTRLLGVVREFADDGRARLSVDTRADLTNLHDTAHGGVILTLIDVAMASAAMSRVDFARSLVTIDLSAQFVGPGSGRLIADGRVVGGGSSVCFCEATVATADGALVARGMGSFKYVKPR
jgi:uncharacterized protein (TIGR00369 family)